jgi:UDP-glucose 4-epimerase
VQLVTGGGGFIGSHLARALVQRGDAVRVLDNGLTGSRERIADVLANVEWMEGDIRDADTLRRACRGVEVVFHQAAVPSVPRTITEPEMTHAINLTGTLNVLVAAREAGVRRVMFASSCAVYGNHPVSPKAESLPPQPLSPYAVHKLAAETYCSVWHTIYGLETVALRYFNVFGPSQDPRSDYAAVIPRFITAALAGTSPTIYGDGEQSRDFIYAGDVVEANLRAAIAPTAAGKAMNVGTGTSVTLNQLIGELELILERRIEPVYVEPRAGDVRESRADISLLRATLGWAPVTSLHDGLRHTVRAFVEHV